jgi:hypothetical protein
MFKVGRAIRRALVSTWPIGGAWLDDQRDGILAKLEADPNAIAWARRLARRTLRRLATEFPPGYLGGAPRLIKLRLIRTRIPYSMATVKAERKPRQRFVFESVLEGADALEEAHEIRELVIDCVRKIDLALPKCETVTTVARVARAGAEAATQVCVESAVAKTHLLSFKLGPLVPVFEQCGLLIRGKTNALTAAFRGSFAMVAVTVTSWVAKVVGTVVGYFFGGPSGAMWTGTVFSVVVAKATHGLFKCVYGWRAKRAANRLNHNSLETMRAMRRKKAQKLLQLRASRKRIETGWGADWERIWTTGNMRLMDLFESDGRVRDDSVALLVWQLKAIGAGINSGWAHRDFVWGLPLIQRWVLWTSPATRERVDRHFAQALQTIDTILEELARTSCNEHKLRRLLMWLDNQKVCSAGIRATLECHLRARFPIRREAWVLSADIRGHLQESESRWRREFQEQLDQLMTSWELELAHRTTELARYASLVKAAVDKAGMDLVFSPVGRSGRRRGGR